MRFLLPILFFVFFALPVSAQILNIEKLRLEKDTAKDLMIKSTLGLNVYNRSAAASDPVNLFGYNADLNAIYYPGKHAFMFISKFDYLRINKDDFLNFGFVHGRMNFFRDRQVNYELFAQYSYDNFRGLYPRWLGGGSVRYRLIQSERITLVMATGLLYEYERWQHPHTDAFVRADFLKSSSYVNLRITINEMADFNMVNYFQTGYDASISGFRNRLSSTLVLNMKLTSRFSWNNSFDVAYDEKPLTPITRMIYAFKSGLSFDL